MWRIFWLVFMQVLTFVQLSSSRFWRLYGFRMHSFSSPHFCWCSSWDEKIDLYNVPFLEDFSPLREVEPLLRIFCKEILLPRGSWCIWEDIFVEKFLLLISHGGDFYVWINRECFFYIDGRDFTLKKILFRNIL